MKEVIKKLPVDIIREFLTTIDTSVRFSTSDFTNISTNPSATLHHLMTTGEIEVVGVVNVGKQRKPTRIYVKTGKLPKKKSQEKPHTKELVEEWAKVYPEFFSVPDFKILKVTTVKEL